jgi:hypothetical protein
MQSIPFSINVTSLIPANGEVDLMQLYVIKSEGHLEKVEDTLFFFIYMFSDHPFGIFNLFQVTFRLYHIQLHQVHLAIGRYQTCNITDEVWNRTFKDFKSRM